MNNRTELAAGFTGLLNSVFVILNATGAFHVTPEVIGAVNGVLLPTALYFLGNRVTRVETAANAAQSAAQGAAFTSANAANSANRVETQLNEKR